MLAFPDGLRAGLSRVAVGVAAATARDARGGRRRDESRGVARRRLHVTHRIHHRVMGMGPQYVSSLSTVLVSILRSRSFS